MSSLTRHGYWELYAAACRDNTGRRHKRDMATSSVITAAGREDVLEGINDFDKY